MYNFYTGSPRFRDFVGLYTKDEWNPDAYLDFSFLPDGDTSSSGKIVVLDMKEAVRTCKGEEIEVRLYNAANVVLAKSTVFGEGYHGKLLAP
jgi:hypothetical protein